MSCCRAIAVFVHDAAAATAVLHRVGVRLAAWVAVGRRIADPHQPVRCVRATLGMPHGNVFCGLGETGCYW